MIVRSLIVFMVFGLISCSAKKVNEPTARKSVHEITIGDVHMAAQVLPFSPQAKKDTGTKEENELLWFKVNIEKPNVELQKGKQLYINFDMQQDFTLMANGDSLASVFCQRIENGNASNFEYAVAFEQPGAHQQDQYTLVYNDKIFGIGTVAFVYNQNDFTKFRNKK